MNTGLNVGVGYLIYIKNNSICRGHFTERSNKFIIPVTGVLNCHIVTQACDTGLKSCYET